MPFQPFLCHCNYAEICSLGLLFRNAISLKSLKLITFWSPPSKEVEKQTKRQILLNSFFWKISCCSWWIGPSSTFAQNKIHKWFLADWIEGWDLTFLKSFLWAGLTSWKKCCWNGTNMQVYHSAYSKISIKEKVL